MTVLPFKRPRQKAEPLPQGLEETEAKLQKRKFKTWLRIVSDKEIRPAYRTVLWFVIDCMTLPDTMLRYQQETRVVIWPSQEGLAALVGCDRGMVRRAIEAGKKRGYLKQLSTGNGMGGNSEYRVMPLKAAKAKSKSDGVA